MARLSWLNIKESNLYKQKQKQLREEDWKRRSIRLKKGFKRKRERIEAMIEFNNFKDLVEKVVASDKIEAISHYLEFLRVNKKRDKLRLRKKRKLKQIKKLDRFLENIKIEQPLIIYSVVSDYLGLENSPMSIDSISIKYKTDRKNIVNIITSVLID